MLDRGHGHLAATFSVLRLELASGRSAYWTVFDAALCRVPIVDEYLFALQRSGRSENTTRAYALDLAAFLRWAESRRRSWLDPRALSDFQAFLLIDRTRAGQPRSPRSINRQLTAVRGMMRFAAETGHLPSATFGVLCEVADLHLLPLEARGERHVTVLRESPRHALRTAANDAAPATIDVEEYVRLLTAARTNRDRLLLALMHDCGLRIGEALGLWRSDMHLSMGASAGCSILGHTCTYDAVATPTERSASPGLHAGCPQLPKSSTGTRCTSETATPCVPPAKPACCSSTYRETEEPL